MISTIGSIIASWCKRDVLLCIRDGAVSIGSLKKDLKKKQEWSRTTLICSTTRVLCYKVFTCWMMVLRTLLTRRSTSSKISISWSPISRTWEGRYLKDDPFPWQRCHGEGSFSVNGYILSAKSAQHLMIDPIKPFTSLYSRSIIHIIQ